jgi:hypothetical protein
MDWVGLAGSVELGAAVVADWRTAASPFPGWCVLEQPTASTAKAAAVEARMMRMMWIPPEIVTLRVWASLRRADMRLAMVGPNAADVRLNATR